MNRITISLLMLFSTPAFALNGDYYTYDGFSEIVNAFTRISLVFNHFEYLALISVFAVLGLFFGGLVAYGKILLGGQSSGSLNLSWLLAAMIGVMVFKGLVTPKGTLHIYDPVKNAYVAVAGVPDLIILLATMTNTMERAVIKIVDGSSAHPYSVDGTGLGFELLLSATSDTTFSNDYHLMRNIKKYYSDCSALALVLPSYSVDINTLRSGTSDLIVQFEQMKSNSAFTTMTSPSEKSGEVMTCTNAFDTVLKPALVVNADATFKNFLETTCTKAGLDVTDVNQLEKCKTLVGKLHENFGVSGGTSTQFLRSVVLANAAATAVQDENPDIGVRALTNRSMITEGLGASVSAQEWMPKIRASVTAISLSIMPLLVLFLVTPIWTRSLTVIITLLGWITLWGIIDVIISQVAMDQAIDAIDELKRHQTGVTGLFLAPEAATKAVALFGKARGMSMMIASFLTTMLFKVSSHAMSSMASNWSGQADRKGIESANQTLTPEAHAQTLKNMSEGISVASTIGHNGFGAYTEQAMFQQQRNISAATTEMQGLQTNNPGWGVLKAGDASGAVSGGQSLGNIDAHSSNVQGGGAASLLDSSRSLSGTNTSSAIGSTQGMRDAASSMGFGSVAAMQAFQTATREKSSYGENRTMGAMVEQMRMAHPNLSESQAFEGIAAAKNANLLGALQTFNHDPEQMAAFQKLTSTMNAQQMSGTLDALQRLNVSPTEAWHAVGASQGINAAATSNVLSDVGHNASLVSAYVNQMRSTQGGLATSSVASENNMTIPDLLRQTSEYQNRSDVARMEATESIGKYLGLSTQDYMERTNLANPGAISLTRDEIEKLHNNGNLNISARQLEEIPEEGGRFTFTQSKDGTPTFASVDYGTKTHEDNSTTINEGKSTNTANTYGQGTATDILSNPNRKDELAEKLMDWYYSQNLSDKNNFMSSAANDLNSVRSGNANDTDSRRWDVNANIGFNSSNMNALKSLKEGLGISFGVGGGLNASTSTSDSTNSDINRQILDYLPEYANNFVDTSINNGVNVNSKRELFDMAAERVQEYYRDLESINKQFARSDSLGSDQSDIARRK